MGFELRRPEGAEIDDNTIKLFSRVAKWTGMAAALRVRKTLGPAIRQGMKVLDVGTGPGIIPIHLKRSYPYASLIGLDISLKMIKTASHHNRKLHRPLDLLVGDGQRLPFKSGSLNIIISFFALHHMEHPEKLLMEADRVLKPDGRLLIIDFRRDMPKALFMLLDTIWQLFFLCSSGRRGFHDSVPSAWLPDEIESILVKNNLNRFRVDTTKTELWITND
ncbi:MAG: methyltransferase domain-containing protein [Deltaproteobacteria bacterium]|nr:methyltransferase domain-containing protein [Deltaproteobacteria bacterium]